MYAGCTGTSVHRLQPPLGNKSQWPPLTGRLDLCPGHRELVTVHTSVCALPPTLRPLWPAEDPLPGPTPIHLAGTPRVCETLLQVVHYLFPGKAPMAQAPVAT